MKTGDILLVSGHDDQSRIIQKFQMKADKESGKWNHSGVIYRTENGIYVTEAGYVKDRKLKAAVIIRPLSDYQDGKHELLLLESLIYHNLKVFEPQLLRYAGVPYDYWSLIHDQVIRTLGLGWVGRKGEKAARRMLCHEFTQKAWDGYYPGIFPKWWEGDVSNIYHSDMFSHREL